MIYLFHPLSVDDVRSLMLILLIAFHVPLQLSNGRSSTAVSVTQNDLVTPYRQAHIAKWERVTENYTTISTDQSITEEVYAKGTLSTQHQSKVMQSSNGQVATSTTRNHRDLDYFEIDESSSYLTDEAEWSRLMEENNLFHESKDQCKFCAHHKANQKISEVTSYQRRSK